MSKIAVYINGVNINAHPNYPEDFKISMERESGEMYFRTKLDLSLTFFGDDYDAIYAASIDAEFKAEVRSDTNVLLATGTFEKTDCTFDTDNRICEVKVTSADAYDKIINGKDDEYDLVALAPVRESVSLLKRPVLQIYYQGDSKLTNIIGNVSYEVDAKSEVNDSGTLGNMGFVAKNKFASFHLEIEGMFTAWLGDYQANYEGTSTKFTNEYGYWFQYKPNSDGAIQQQIYFPSGAAVSGYYLEVQQGKVDTQNLSDMEIVTRSSPTSAGTTVGKATLDRKFCYARVLFDSDSPTVHYGDVVELGSEDIAGTNLNYRYAMKPGTLPIENYLVQSLQVQDAPTEWGVNGDGKYYVQPVPTEGAAMIPIGWNKWIPQSFWYEALPTFSLNMEGLSDTWTLRDAYPLWSAISVLLKKIDPTITFAGTSAYSEFLYGSVETIPDWVENLLYITPVTNVKKTYYNQAARKGKITLGQILDMLKNTCQLYWFIDDQKRLRIEHISWFKNGGGYSQTAPVADLTAIVSPMSGKPWTFGVNEFTYSKKDINKRYEFGWHGNSSDVFDGWPIDIKNRHAQNGKTVKSTVSNFLSDVDFIISTPDNVDNDCFALIGADAQGNCQLAVIDNLDTPSVPATQFLLQNAYLSFYFLELAYWTYDLGGDNAYINGPTSGSVSGGVVNVKGTQRIRKQSVRFPIEASKVGKLGLYKTALGSGEWVSAEYTPEDGMISADIILD